MDSILLPKAEIKKTVKEPNKAALVLEPCYQGYGTTIGNALRRVLLSSIPGAAVTAMKIKGVDHEFTAIPNVKEDAVQIMLNLKQLRLRIHTTEPVRLHLYTKGEKAVTAKDFESSADVEIINPDLVIAHLTDANAEFDAEIFAEQGKGYIMAEEKTKKELELGVIAIDSVFTPIRNVGFKVEPVRVGQITNFDRLILEIETDGSITAENALQQAVDILINHLNLVKNLGQEKTEVLPETEAVEEAVKPIEETAPAVEEKSEMPEGSKEEGEKKRGRKKVKKEE